VTPCDEWSPYGELARRENGYILLIGVTHSSNTTFHHVEELGGLPYHMQAGFAAATVIVHGVPHTRHVMLHRYGPERDFDVMEPLFLEQGIQRTGQVGAATVRLVHAQSMVRATLRAVAADPTLLLAK
jgi:aminoglycoside 3-N-acetyltransferase